MSALGDSVVGARVVDLFAGSGALGLEALSRGAASGVFVEKARTSVDVIRRNVILLGAAEETTIISDDVFRFLRRLDEPFDLAFAELVAIFRSPARFAIGKERSRRRADTRDRAQDHANQGPAKDRFD